MAKKYDDSIVDLRSIKLNIARGDISKKEYEDFLKSLPDLSNQLEELPAFSEEEQEKEKPEGGSNDLTFSVV